MTVFYLNALNLYPFHEISKDSLGILLTGVLSVITGYIFASLVFIKSTVQSYERKVYQETQLFNPNRLRTLTLLTLGFLAFGGYGSFRVISALAGGAKFYFINPFLVRELVVAIQMGEIGNVPVLYKISGFAISVGMLANIFGGALFSYQGRYKLIGFLPVILTLIVSLVFIRRYSFVAGLTLWLSAYLFSAQILHAQSKEKLFRRIVLISASMVLVIYLVSYFVIHVRTFYHPKVTEYFYESLYAYFVGGLSSLDIWLKDPNDLIHHSYGQTTFKDIFRWLSRFGIWPSEEVKTVHQDFVLISKHRMINTYTFVKAMYEDFNIFGVLSLSFIWGFLSKAAVVKFFRRPDYIGLLLVSIVTFSLLMSFYSFYFRNLMGPLFWLICVGLIQKYVSGKDVDTSSNNDKPLPA
ncbi:MAG: oligosaccharide repeat unit polymerase [Candidatus Marinimicrobia bacterium]|nr:oligosaccharide repeat unit polymerase [Candidatus Neomarinimicrobiota bacterium]MCF7850494.1 oligosaccharide repeat unit polymerase [Candidatus Neomarinimicrobiota bacterium]